LRPEAAQEGKKAVGGRRNPLIRLNSAKEMQGFNLDFVALDLEIVAPGLVFVAKNLDFLADLEILHPVCASACP
jgi:hypothetical protein